MPAKMTVTAKVPANKEKNTPELGPATISVDSGESAVEMIKMFGDEPVKTNAHANWTVVLQAGIRAGLKAGLDQAAIQGKLGAAKMGVAQARGIVDPQQAYLALFQSSTPEKQAQMLAELTSKAKGLAGKK